MYYSPVIIPTFGQNRDEQADEFPAIDPAFNDAENEHSHDQNGTLDEDNGSNRHR